MSAGQFQEISKDIRELEELRKLSLRGNVQLALDSILTEWRLKSGSEKSNDSSEQNPSTTTASVVAKMPRPVKKLITYAFDESDKFVKLYYHLPGAENLQQEGISSKFSTDSLEIYCKDLNGIDYEIHAKGFIHDIDPEKCSVKPKVGSLLVMLKKKRDLQSWGNLLKIEKLKEPKAPKLDDTTDPQESLMNLMKQMYDDGDDQMKQTIRKAWHESQTKKTTLDGI